MSSLRPIEVGVKTDDGKERWDLLPWDALKEIVRVMTANVKPQGKYEPHNWAKGLSYSRLFAATQRHLTAWYGGETLDPDTGLHHLAHAGCNILFLLAYHVRGFAGDQVLRDQFDDRPEGPRYG